MIADMKNRANWQVDAAREASTGSASTVPPIKATGRVRLDLGATCTGVRSYDWSEGEREVAQLLKRLEFAPAGAEVVLLVAAGQLWPGEGIAHVRTFCGHLGSITVECSDPVTVRSWVLALRGGVR